MKSLLLISFSMLLFSCGSKQSNETQVAEPQTSSIVTLTPEQVKNAAIVTGIAESKDISSVLKVNGKIDVPPQNMVSVSVPLGGYLKYTQLMPGMHVSKGEVIAVMEDQQYIQLQEDYLSAQSKLTFMESDYHRQKVLNETKASSDKVFQQSESEFKTQKIRVKSLFEKLKLIGIDPAKLNESSISRSLNIVAPIDGFVSSVNVNIGKFVNPSEVLFNLVNPTDIHLALNIFEKDLDKVFVGQSLESFTNHHPEKRYKCEVILVSKNLSDERSVEVHCHFDEYDKSLIPGMFMNAELNVKTNKSLVLPEDAVVSFENKEYIFIEKGNNQFEMKEVKTGGSDKGSIEITTLPEGFREKIVMKGAYELLMCAKNLSED